MKRFWSFQLVLRSYLYRQPTALCVCSLIRLTVCLPNSFVKQQLWIVVRHALYTRATIHCHVARDDHSPTPHPPPTPHAHTVHHAPPVRSVLGNAFRKRARITDAILCVCRTDRVSRVCCDKCGGGNFKNALISTVFCLRIVGSTLKCGALSCGVQRNTRDIAPDSWLRYVCYVLLPSAHKFSRIYTICLQKPTDALRYTG